MFRQPLAFVVKLPQTGTLEQLVAFPTESVVVVQVPNVYAENENMRYTYGTSGRLLVDLVLLVDVEVLVVEFMLVELLVVEMLLALVVDVALEVLAEVLLDVEVALDEELLESEFVELIEVAVFVENGVVVDTCEVVVSVAVNGCARITPEADAPMIAMTMTAAETLPIAFIASASYERRIQWYINIRAISRRDQRNRLAFVLRARSFAQAEILKSSRALSCALPIVLK